MRWAILLAVAVLAACQPALQHGSTESGGDGLTMESAVVINAKTDMTGTQAVYAWLREHCNCRVKGQSLVTDAGRAYDVMAVTLADGSDRSYYFDISKSFGKF